MLSFLADFFNKKIEDLNGLMNRDLSGLITGLTLALAAIILMAALYIFFIWLCLQISRKIFSVIQRKRGKKIHLQFAENITKAVILLVFIVIPLAGDQIRRSILGSAAVIAAIVGFAAQDIIKDILSGLLISIYKPFDLGDRIELDDGTSGIVERITLRHVAVKLVDTVRLIIPNNKLNSAVLKNYSYDYVPRSVQFKFPVGYNSDIAKTKEIIAKSVEESSYSIPGLKRNRNSEKEYAPVYFISIEESALTMLVTVYYNSTTPTEVLRDDINTRVFTALEKAGIEVPYPHETVYLKQ